LLTLKRFLPIIKWKSPAQSLQNNVRTEVTGSILVLVLNSCIMQAFKLQLDITCEGV